MMTGRSLSIIVLTICAPLISHAQVSLKICNHGKSAVSVVAAKFAGTCLMCDNWKIAGWTNVSPSDCETLHTSNEIVLGFAFTDRKGNERSGSPSNADIAFHSFFGNSSAAEFFDTSKSYNICVTNKGFDYSVDKLTQKTCGSNGHLFPLTTDFNPSSLIVEHEMEITIPLNFDQFR